GTAPQSSPAPPAGPPRRLAGSPLPPGRGTTWSGGQSARRSSPPGGTPTPRLRVHPGSLRHLPRPPQSLVDRPLAQAQSLGDLLHRKTLDSQGHNLPVRLAQSLLPDIPPIRQRRPLVVYTRRAVQVVRHQRLRAADLL